MDILLYAVEDRGTLVVDRALYGTSGLAVTEPSITESVPLVGLPDNRNETKRIISFLLLRSPFDSVRYLRSKIQYLLSPVKSARGGGFGILSTAFLTNQWVWFCRRVLVRDVERGWGICNYCKNYHG